MPAKRSRIFRRKRKFNFIGRGNTCHYEAEMCREINRAEFINEFRAYVATLHF